jgi:hypothetical protein
MGSEIYLTFCDFISHRYGLLFLDCQDLVSCDNLYEFEELSATLLRKSWCYLRYTNNEKLVDALCVGPTQDLKLGSEIYFTLCDVNVT